MSEYGYDDRRRSHRTRERDQDYGREDTYIERGSGPSELAYRPRDDSIEDIPRKFPPPGDNYGRHRDAPRSSRGYDDDYYSDRGHGRRSGGGRSRRDDGYYSDERDAPRRDRRKSIGDQLKEVVSGAGIGGILGNLAGGGERSRSRDRGGRDRRDHRDHRDHRERRSRYSSSSSRSRDRGGRNRESSRGKWEQAAKAAVVAGAVEAFRSRKTPGAWTGEKGQRIATAALGAAGIDGFVDRDPDKKSKRHIAESALGGLVANRLAHGSRSRSRTRGRDDSRSSSRSPSRSRSRARSIFGRSRSRGRDRSQSRGGDALKNVAGAGAVMAAGKALYDRVRSKSRGAKARDRSRSVSSEDSYVPSRGRRYDKQKDSEDYNNERSMTGPAAGAGAVATTNQNRGRRDESASSDSTTDMEQKRKKLRGKELLTAGFATVATIHAAHGVYNSMVASEKRRKLVAEGDMTPEVARKQKSKNMLQDAAAVGIAALGIKGAFSEWKEMNEQRHQCHEMESKRRKRRKAKEKRDREMRAQGMMLPVANPPYGGYAPPMPYPESAGYPVAQVPSPPMGSVGGGSQRY